MEHTYSNPQASPAATPCNIFFRIPKTASFTLRNLVSREYRKVPCLDTDFPLLSPESWQHFLKCVELLPEEKRAQYRSIVGHMKFGVHEILPGSARYVTFLRDPVKRFASYYYMLRRIGLVIPTHRFEPTRPDWNMPGHESFPRELDNCQTRALANADLNLPFGQCTEKHLEQAKANIEKHFVFVGLTERFDLSLMLIRRLCGWRWHFYVPKNATPQFTTEQRLCPDVLEAIGRLNRFDRELYSFAAQRFEETVRQQGLSLKIEHAGFISCNLLHKKFHRIYRPLKRAIRGDSKVRKRTPSTKTPTKTADSPSAE